MISVRTLLGVLLGLVGSANAQQKQPIKEEEGVIEPQADVALHRMSDYLAGLKEFRLDTTTVDEKVTTEHQKIQELKESKVAVKRPGKLRIERVGPKGHALFIDDGQQFTLYNVDRNVYANGAAPATIDDAVDHARDRLNIDAPGGDLIVSDVYQALTDGLKVGRYVGLEPIGGVRAHHLAVTKKDVDYQIWIQDGPQPVPLRYVIVSKDMPSQPEYTLEMRNWDTSTSIPDDQFKVAIPKEAKRVDLTSRQPEPKP